MNNVNNRKMFAKRDARNKLAEMGGIMSSSPELLGEAQKFANGGSTYVPNQFAMPDRRRLEDSAFTQYGMTLNADNTLSPYKTASDALYDRTMADQSGSFSASQPGEEENENVVRAQLLQRFGDRIGDSILNTAKQLRAKARILGGVPDILASYVQEATGLVQSTLGFTEAGATSFDDAEKLRTDTLKNMGSSASDLLNLSNEGRSLSLMPDMSIDRYGLNVPGGDSPRERIRRLNAQKENASQVEYEAGLPALREKLSALEGNDPMGMLSDTFVGSIQRPEGGYSTEMSNLSPAPGQAEAIFGTGAGARFAGSEFTDFEQLAKDNPEMMAANYGMLQAQDAMTNQGIVNSLDPESRAALSAQQDLTREEFLNRMPEPSGNVTPLSKDLQLNTLPSEQALAEAGDYNMARDIGAANEAAAMFNQPGGINSQGPNPEVTPKRVFDRELFEANALKNKENQTVIDNAAEELLKATTEEEKSYFSNIIDSVKKDASVVTDAVGKAVNFGGNVIKSIGDFDDSVTAKNEARKEKAALNDAQNAEARKFIDGMTEADKFNKQFTSAEKDTMREEYLNRVSDDPEVDENTFINKLDGWLTSFDDAVFGRNNAAKVAAVVGEVITPDGSGLEGNTTEELKALALADSDEEKIVNNNKKASSNGNVVTTSTAENNILSSVEQGNAALDLALGGTGEVSTSTTLTQKNKEMQKLYQEMFGEDEKEVAAAKWNQLAMVGFAIAAGKDPNALTNIAAGLLSGAKQKRQDTATRKARRDKIKMSAFDAALSQTTADMSFEKALQVANIRANSGSGYGKALNPSRIIENARAAAKTAWVSDGGFPADMIKGETQEQYISRAIEDALKEQERLLPTYSSSSSESDNNGFGTLTVEE